MEPVPLTYLMAAGLGLVVGVIMDLVLGWPWWWVAIAVMAMVWLFCSPASFTPTVSLISIITTFAPSAKRDLARPSP